MHDDPHDSFEPEDEFPDVDWEAWQRQEALLERAEALMDVGRAADALPLLHEALSQAPESLRAHCFAGFAYLLLGRYADAERHAVQAIQLEPDEEWGHRLHAYALSATGRKAEGVEAALRAGALEPDNLYVIQAVVDTALEDEQRALAREWAETARSEYPGERATYQMLGEVAAAEGAHLEAEVHFREALRLEPTTATLCDLAETLQALGRQSEARECLDQAIRLDPADKRTRRALFFSLARYDRGGCLARAAALGAAGVGAWVLWIHFHWHPLAAGATALALLLGLRRAWQWRGLARLPRSAAAFYRTERRAFWTDILSGLRCFWERDASGESLGDVFRQHGPAVLAFVVALGGTGALLIWPLVALFTHWWNGLGYLALFAVTMWGWAYGLRRTDLDANPDAPRGKSLREEYWTYNPSFRELVEMLRLILALLLALGGTLAALIWPVVMMVTNHYDGGWYWLLVAGIVWGWVQVSKLPGPEEKKVDEVESLPVAAVIGAEEALPVAQVIAPPPGPPSRS